MPRVFRKDPSDKEDYEILWADWLGTDTITASIWDVPAGITKVDDDFTTTSTTITLSGGDLGQDYVITNHITTAAGREKDRTNTWKIRAKL